MLKNENNISVEESDDSVEQPIDLNDASSELLLTLEKDLKEIDALELRYKEDENSEDDSEDGFLTEHFEEYEDLKKIFASSGVTLGDISWFFRTALFDLMSVEPESFVIEPIEIYECMLERIQISSKEVFRQHLKILLDKKTEDKSMFAFARFFPVLREAREKGSSEVNRKRRFSEENSQNKRIKLTPSPLSMENNQLSNPPTSDDQEAGISLTI
jgi:hypothetical protein